MRYVASFSTISLLIAFAAPASAPAQHNVDVWIGRTADGNALNLGGRVFDIERAHLPYVDGLLHGYADNVPGFDRVITPDPNHNLYALENGAMIWLEVVAAPPDFHIFTDTWVEVFPGDTVYLGDAYLHVHYTWWIDIDSLDHDPNDWVWPVTFILHDQGAPAYASTPPFTLEFTNVANCRPGDIDDNGIVDYFDIQAFLDTLGGSGDRRTRCSADCNGDNDVDYFDIKPFIDLLGTQYD